MDLHVDSRRTSIHTAVRGLHMQVAPHMLNRKQDGDLMTAKRKAPLFYLADQKLKNENACATI